MPVLVMEELPLLSSRLKLPRDFCVSYAIFTSSSHHSIDAARRLVFSSNHSTLLLDSLLTTVHIGSPSFLHVFLLSTQSNLSIATSTLNHLHFDGLSGIFLFFTLTLTLFIVLLQQQSLIHLHLFPMTFIILPHPLLLFFPRNLSDPYTPTLSKLFASVY